MRGGNHPRARAPVALGAEGDSGRRSVIEHVARLVRAGGRGVVAAVWRFLSWILDALVSGECLICASPARPLEPFSAAILPVGWPIDLDEFLATEFRLPVLGNLSVRADVLCPSCWLSLEPVCGAGMLESDGPRATGIPVVSPFHENDALLAVIRFLKFSGGRAAVPPLVWWMAKALGAHRAALAGDALARPLLVPVPLHPRRERSRGYNQADLLARGVGQRLGIEVDDMLLARVKNTRPQSKLASPERSENVLGAFALRRPDRAAGRDIVLVDDLVTTGETIRACAGALAAAAPASVSALAAGRSRRSPSHPGLDRAERIV